MKQVLTVIQHEYLVAVKSKTFWITAIGLPLFLLAALFIGSLAETETSPTNLLNPKLEGDYAILDEGDYVDLSSLGEIKVIEVQSKNEGIELIEQNEVEAFIIYPEDIQLMGSEEGSKVGIYFKKEKLEISTEESQVADLILKFNAINRLNGSDRDKVMLSSAVQIETINLIDDSEAKGLDAIIVPGILFFFFYIVVLTSGTTLLQSVAEEKENRMIEVILSVISAKNLIWGKTFSILLTTITQLILWIIFLLIIINLSGNGLTLPFSIDFNNLQINFWITGWSIIVMFFGIIAFAGLMAGVGALGKNYKDSNQLAALVIIFPVIPMMFIGLLIDNPNNIFANIASYIPFMSPMIWILRSVFELQFWEYFAALIVNFIYMILALKLSVWLFKLGSLETGRTINWKDVFKKINTRN